MPKAASVRSVFATGPLNGAGLPLSAGVPASLSAAVAHGWGDKDAGELARFFREQMGQRLDWPASDKLFSSSRYTGHVDNSLGYPTQFTPLQIVVGIARTGPSRNRKLQHNRRHPSAYCVQQALRLRASHDGRFIERRVTRSEQGY